MNCLSRRRFLLTTSVVSATTLLLPGVVNANSEKQSDMGGLVSGLPKPLNYKSIPGFLSEKQLNPHYKAHYGGALQGYLAADKKIQSGIFDERMDADAYGALQRARSAKANSVVLHELYFDGMTSNSGGPSKKTHAAIKKRFGTIDKWAADFQAAAKAASGWAILAHHPLNGKLYNVVSDNHATGVLWMARPLVVLDVYEHAFYVDYKNDKSLYIKKFMTHIDWNAVDGRLGQTI